MIVIVEPIPNTNILMDPYPPAKSVILHANDALLLDQQAVDPVSMDSSLSLVVQILENV